MLAHAAPPIAPSAGSAGLSADARAIVVLPPVVQAAAVAAGGFLAGVAAVLLAHRRRERALVRTRRRRRGFVLRRRHGRGRQDAARGASVVEIVGSRSLLVDVHLLAGRD